MTVRNAIPKNEETQCTSWGHAIHIGTLETYILVGNLVLLVGYLVYEKVATGKL